MKRIDYIIGALTSHELEALAAEIKQKYDSDLKLDSRGFYFEVLNEGPLSKLRAIRRFDKPYFECSHCVKKDAEIAHLKKQIASLKRKYYELEQSVEEMLTL